MSELIGKTGVVVRNIARADQVLVDELRRFGVGTPAGRDVAGQIRGGRSERT